MIWIKINGKPLVHSEGGVHSWKGNTTILLPNLLHFRFNLIHLKVKIAPYNLHWIGLEYPLGLEDNQL